MSFSKARIQRFNDIKDCSPSPAKYNITQKAKLKYGIIAQSERFVQKLDSPITSDAGSAQSQPCFLTPTALPKKKRFLGFSSSKSKSIDLEELKERIVECNNKDLYIKELTEQIEEMKNKISNLEKSNVQLEAEKSHLNTEIESLNQNHIKAVDNLSTKYTKDFLEINMKVLDLDNELSRIKQTCDQLRNENFVDISKLCHYINKFEELHTKTVEEHLKELDRQREDFLNRIKKIQEQHEKNIELLKIQHKNELNEKLTELENKNGEMAKILQESEAKIKLLEENFKEAHVLAEIQTKERIEQIERDFKNKLEDQEKQAEAILKECQEISEYNIIESEIEKNKYKTSLAEKEAQYDNLKVEYEEMVEKLKAVNVSESQIEVSKLNELVSKLRSEKRAYEVSINTYQETIEVLKKRLIKSDRDVEQFKEELAKNDERIVEMENKCGGYQNQLEEARTKNEDLELEIESTAKLMKDEVENVKKCLIGKVEQLEKELQSQLLKNEEQHKLFSEVYEQLQEQQEVANQARELIDHSHETIERLEYDNKELESENVQLEVQLKEVKEKLEEETEEAAEIRKKYIEKSGKYDELSQKFERLLQQLNDSKQQNCQLREKVKSLESLIGPFQEQLEAYDIEVKLLSQEKSNIESELEKLEKKYVDILGHQNHKQKIRHLNDMQKKINEFIQLNTDLESKNYKLSKQVEKLKKELEDTHKRNKKVKSFTEGKENLPSPVRSLNKENVSSPKVRVESPGPLKEKN